MGKLSNVCKLLSQILKLLPVLTILTIVTFFLYNFLVPLERLELPTHGVETRCSNSTELKRYIHIIGWNRTNNVPRQHGIEPPGQLPHCTISVYYYVFWWAEVESNHRSRIFSPAHQPCMSSAHMYWRGQQESNLPAAGCSRLPSRPALAPYVWWER